MISICHEGTPEEVKKYHASLFILLEHIVYHPSKTNYKVIESALPNLMLMHDFPNQAIKELFLTTKEDGDITSEFFLRS